MPGATKDAPPSAFYQAAVKRFARSYKKHFPALEHKLILVNSNGGYNSTIEDFFEGIPYEMVSYNGSGWDIGGHQFVINSLNSIFLFSSIFISFGWGIIGCFNDTRLISIAFLNSVRVKYTFL